MSTTRILPSKLLAELALARQAHLCALRRVIEAGGSGLLVDDMRTFESEAWRLIQTVRRAA